MQLPCSGFAAPAVSIASTICSPTSLATATMCHLSISDVVYAARLCIMLLTSSCMHWQAMTHQLLSLVLLCVSSTTGVIF